MRRESTVHEAALADPAPPVSPEVAASRPPKPPAETWPRRRRTASSLFAAGEPMMWLTGGALVISTLMVLGLLSLVLAKGLSTFWPASIERLATPDGRLYMGELTREDTYRPSESALADLSPELQERARRELARGEGRSTRRLVKTGNYRLTGTHFQWVDDFEVAERSTPEWALVLERLEWGRFYGFPEAFVLYHPLSEGELATPESRREGIRRRLAELGAGGGRELRLVPEGGEGSLESFLDPAEPDAVELDSAEDLAAVAEITTGPEAVWRRFQETHGEVRDRWQRRRKLEKIDTGEVNHRQEQARLAEREAELELEKAQEGSARHEEALLALAAAREEHERVRAWADEEFQRIRRDIDRINAENGRYQLVMRTAGEGDRPPQNAFLRLDEVVRAYPANQLSLLQKAGVYLSRWWEFLSDEPREANSAGGVFPAIFGTVVMTLIMSLAVVPFGVLAALYLREYAKPGPLVSSVRIAVNNLAGVPSIVFGVFGLGFFCYVVGASLDQLLFAAHLPNPTFGKGGLLWASLTLALLTLPVVIVATEEAVAAVPSSMREGSYACGASKWQTIQRIVLPRALPGIITGMILAIARGAGEVAPLMLVGAVKLAPELPIDGIFPYLHPERSFMHLGFHIFDVGFQSQDSESAKPMVYTTTLLLIAIIALLNLATIWLRSTLRRKFAAGKF